jgi:hypothetical protein
VYIPGCPIRTIAMSSPPRSLPARRLSSLGNLRDFPTKELKKHGLVRQNPDVFLTDLYDKAPDLILASLANARRNLSKTRIWAPTSSIR